MNHIHKFDTMKPGYPCECGLRVHPKPKWKDFEAFLQDKHAAQYVGLDDEMPEDYEDWLSDLDIYDIIKWADEYAEGRANG